MAPEQSSDQSKLQLSLQQKVSILLSFAKDKIIEQIQCVWFIIMYLIVFQILVLGLPIVYSLMIAVGILIVIVGLAFFMEGLRLGLMPLGETLGSTLPRKKILGIPCLPASLAFGFVLGAFATFAEPAIGVLRAAGSGVDPTAAPLLWTILNTGAAMLVNCVGVGVGIAVMLGVLRFYKGWSLKPFIYIGVIVLSCITLYMQFSDDRLKHVLGLAWDCGAVTTGPVTVPLVLALGIGVCRIVSTGGSSNTGFGVVTLASLFPILAVMCYALFLFNTDKYYMAKHSVAEWHMNAGEYGKNYPKDLQQYGDIVAAERLAASGAIDEKELFWSLSKAEREAVDKYLQDNHKLPDGYEIKTRITEGKIVPSSLSDNEKDSRENVEVQGAKTYVVRKGFKAPDGVWDEDADIATAFSNKFNFFPNTFKPEEDKNGNGTLDKDEDFYSVKADGITLDYSKGNGKLDGPDQDRGALEGAIWAIVPLCSILLLVLIGGLRQKPKYLDELFIGIACAVIGMCLFNLGIALGLTPLGEQLGGNVVSSFTSIQPWQSEGFVDPLFKSSTAGKCLAILFGFILGYGATLAEPALNALGSTVEKITVGAFKKNLLMQAVATGVALGIATGVAKIAFNLELWYLLIPPYALLLILTYFSNEDFVNFGWDSAGVTTGPITVPLVLAMGLGIGAKTGAIDGFGVLSLASVGPIITVLTVGLLVKKKPSATEKMENSMEAA
jgi:multisubunit Na+/H+ antiporter MnhC subunit